jgi:putative ABC transport system permease protein
MLEEKFEQSSIKISSIEKISDARAQVEFLFNLIVFFMLIMAVLLAVVGGLGLMGTMSINVLERTREIGVMRAVGASNMAVFRIVVVEGVVIGLLSWLLGAVIAFPVSKVLSSQVGVQLLGAPLSYSFSTSGTVIWFIVAVGLAALASFLPARGATRLTVREVLAYE